MCRTSCSLRYVVFVVFALLLAACSGNEPAAPVAVGATGISVAPEFAAYYEQYGGVRVFGYPITEDFPPTDDERLTQYFQTMRLDYMPSQPPGQQVSVYPLGEWAIAGVQDPEPAPVSENGRVQFFPETGYSVQDEFLTFYEEHNGPLLFGPPISPQLNEGGLRVQYFRNVRLEWRPELPTDQRVQLSLLGLAHFDTEMVFTYQRIYARPVSSAGIEAVDVSASVKSPVLYNGEEQVLYVTAQTQDGRSVSELRVGVAITYNGDSHNLDIGMTGGDGRIQVPLDLTGVPPGTEIQLLVTVYNSSGDVLGTDTLGFRTWW